VTVKEGFKDFEKSFGDGILGFLELWETWI
jgi:hypothetical protein